MKSVHKYMDECSKLLFDTPIEALESERASRKRMDAGIPLSNTDDK